MATGFFNPYDLVTYNNVVIPSFNSLLLRFKGVEELNKSVSENSSKNIARLKSILEEDLVIITADSTDPDTLVMTPADLDMALAYEATDIAVDATITKINSVLKYHLFNRVLRMLYLNKYDEITMASKLAVAHKDFTEKLKLDATTPWIIDGTSILANFPILSTPYPDNDTIPDNDFVYRNMVAHEIEAKLGYNIITSEFTWISFEYNPASGIATHWRVRLTPSSETQRQQMMEIVSLISVSAASGAGAQGIINPYRFLHFAGQTISVA